MTKWSEVAIRDVAKVVGGATPRTADESFWGGEIPWLTPKDLSDNPSRYTARGNRSITEAGLKSCAAALLPVNTVLLTSRAPIGYVSIAAAPISTNQGFKSLILNHGQVPLFWFYLLGSSKSYIESRANGSTFKEIGGAALSELTFTVPDEQTQQNIAMALGAFDDLIEAENKLVSDIDNLVRALGRSFLEKQIDRPKAPLRELCEISKGYSYASSELVPSGQLLVTLKNVGRGGEFKARGFKPLTATPKASQFVENGDILVAQTDLTQDRDVIGRPIRVRRGSFKEDLVASLDLVIVRPGNLFTNEYLYAVLDSFAFRSHALAHCNGTTVVHMASAAVPTFQAPIPDEVELAEFSNQIKILRDLADCSISNVELLENVRDQLLPHLLTGRIEITGGK